MCSLTGWVDEKMDVVAGGELYSRADARGPDERFSLRAASKQR